MKKMIRSLFRRITNTYEYEYKLEKLQEQVDSVYYILNNCMGGVACAKPAVGDLRKLQEADIMLLKVFDLICRINHIKYWAEWGTLLGAVRHKGFIPWDDDLDVACFRKDYNRLASILKETLPRYNIHMYCGVERLGIGYKTGVTGIWMDVYPNDIFLCGVDRDKAIKISKEMIKQTNEMLAKSKGKRDYSDYFDEWKMKKIDDFCCTDEIRDGGIVSRDPDMTIALSNARNYYSFESLRFEGLDITVPSGYNEILIDYYGNYWEFPQSGFEHHGGEIKLSKRARENGIDMDTIILELENIYQRIEAECD